MKKINKNITGTSAPVLGWNKVQAESITGHLHSIFVNSMFNSLGNMVLDVALVVVLRSVSFAGASKEIVSVATLWDAWSWRRYPRRGSSSSMNEQNISVARSCRSQASTCRSSSEFGRGTGKVVGKIVNPYLDRQSNEQRPWVPSARPSVQETIEDSLWEDCQL